MKRKFLTCVVAVLLVATMAFTVSATAEKPYDYYTTYIDDYFLWETAVARIVKCDCLPVDNYLLASLKIQYLEGNQYLWSPNSTQYYPDDGSNIPSMEYTMSKTDIVYAESWFAARCGDGKQVNIFDSVEHAG